MQHVLPFLIESPSTQPPAPGQRTRHIILDGTVISYSLRRSKRKTIGIAVDERGLHAAAPRWVTVAEVEAFIAEKKRWILRRLAEAQSQRREPFQWKFGAQLPYLGGYLSLERGGIGGVVLSGTRLQAQATEDMAYLRRNVIEWFKSTSRDHFAEKIARMAPLLEVPIPQLGLSQAKTQWGSCIRKESGQARVLLNWKLMHYEERLIDYVVAHELAHLRHMNHSSRFWRTVEQVYPNYEAARSELRARAHWAPEL
ncbi:MAG TPA: SprT family zinc-dependent metalloprotease [Burkholderiales bacterium]|nr:SprT family zinc-dependent metalloprotease [Burkholderiales bacterium]